MSDEWRIKCTNCGRFIGLQDLIDGKASHNLLTEDTEFSREEFVSLCAKCLSISASRSTGSEET